MLDLELELYRIGYRSWEFYEEQCDVIFNMVLEKRDANLHYAASMTHSEKERRKASKRDWWAKHRTKVARSKRDRTSYLSRRETILERRKTPEAKAKSREYYAQNRDRIRAQQKARKARK